MHLLWIEASAAAHTGARAWPRDLQAAEPLWCTRRAHQKAWWFGRCLRQNWA